MENVYKTFLGLERFVQGQTRRDSEAKRNGASPKKDRYTQSKSRVRLAFLMAGEATNNSLWKMFVKHF